MTAATALQKAFAGSAPEMQASVEKIYSGIRYGEYPAALAELEKLAANPGLNDAQKKTVNDVTEQLKQAAAAPAKTQ
jgi:hypothetical protein